MLLTREGLRVVLEVFTEEVLLCGEAVVMTRSGFEISDSLCEWAETEAIDAMLARGRSVFESLGVAEAERASSGPAADNRRA